MSITIKEIPVTLQRRASELPCDGVKRYKVGKQNGLSYSEARKAILSDGDLGPNDRGGRLLRRGTANRLAELNRTYFRVASGFVVTEVAKRKAAKTQETAEAANAPATPEEAHPDYSPDPTPLDHDGWAKAEATGLVTMVSCLPVGDKARITQVSADGTIVLGSLTHNKSGYRATVNGEEFRSRSAAVIAKRIVETVGTIDWILRRV
jgi:hypothetical protein